MKTYNITRTNNQGSANETIIAKGLSLAKAQAKILEKWNELADKYAETWTEAVEQSEDRAHRADEEEADGRRFFRFDIYDFEICEEN